MRTIARAFSLAPAAGALAILLVPLPALADFCVGDGCGAAREGWHLHCTAPSGGECWDTEEADGSCDIAGSCGTLAGGNVETAAVQTANEIFTQFVAPSTPSAVARRLSEERAAETGRARGMVSKASAIVHYQFYELDKIEAVLYGARLGYDFDSEAVGAGLRVPLQYVHYPDLGLAGYRVGSELYVKAHIVSEPGIGWHLGAAGLFNGVRMEAGNFDYSLGVGPFTSLDLELGPVGLSAGVSGTYAAPQEGQAFFTVVGGGSAGVPLGTSLSLSAHGFYTALYEDDLKDARIGPRDAPGNAYAAVGLEIGMVLASAWTLNGGYDYRFGFGDYTSNEVYLGSAVEF